MSNMSAPKLPPPNLLEQTGLRFPHPGYRNRKDGEDPRLSECLKVLAELRDDLGETTLGDVHEKLLWALCAAVWWCKPGQAAALVEDITRTLRDDR